MIVSEKGLWKKVVPIYGQSAGVVLGISTLVCYGFVERGWKWLAIPTTPFTLVGTGLSILLVFRNNESYGRYWEARTLWGQVLANCRSFARSALTLSRPDASRPGAHDDLVSPELEHARRDLVLRTIAFLHSLPPTLRGDSAAEADFDALAEFLPPGEIETLRAQKNVPAAILHTQGERIADAWHRDFFHPQHVPILDELLSDLTLSYGGCEKIARTPIPPAYGFLARSMVWVFVTLLPFGFVSELGWKTLFLAPLVAFLFGALQRFGEEVEHPFELKHDGLPLDSLSKSLEAELRQRLGEEEHELPEPVEARDGVVL
jgi:putative membrane protein